MRKTEKILKSMGIAAVMMIMGSMVSFADETAQFVAGTTVNGVAVGGQTAEEAKAQVEAGIAAGYKLTLVKKDGTTDEINGTDIGYKVSVSDGFQGILDEQNAGGRQIGPAVNKAFTLTISNAVYDEGILKEKVGLLSCISGPDIVKTMDAHVSAYQEGQPFTIVPEVQGNDTDPEKVFAAVKAAVEAGQTKLDLTEAGCYYTVKVTSRDEQLKQLCDTMNRYGDVAITYTFGETTEELSGEIISSWITGSEDGKVQVDREKVQAYVQTLAEKYNTAGTVRTFRTHGGKDVQLKGPYGWKIDQAAETDALIAAIQTAESLSKEPVYSLSAAGRNLTDWGNTYVEVDLTGQHVYMYKDGTLVWDAPCVTGNVEKGHTTPDGIYSLTYKEKDRILRGAKQADGTYEYESPVDYWMPFNGGIGLHDANWRSKFGGTIYQYGGSHGCINLPPAKAKVLYDLVYKGIPVICYN